MEKLQTVFISGVCGAGKSTMARQLAEILPAAQFSVCEFDYPGVPSNTPDTWRAERTETWLRIAVENARSNISTVVCGLVHPDEVLAASSASLVPPIRFIFLEATHEEIARRLRERYAIPLFAELLWRQDHITPEAFIPTMFPYQRELRDLFSNAKYGTLLVETTGRSVTETTQQLAAWILKQSNPPLEPTARLGDE
jgi:gluconate kinase